MRAFSSRRFQWRDFFRWYLPGLFPSIALWVYGAWRFYSTYQAYRSIDLGVSRSQPWFLLAAAFLIPILYLMIRHLRRVRETVILYEKGLRFRLPSGKSRFYPWEEIVGISTQTQGHVLLGFRLRTELRAILYPRRGDTIELGERIEDLPILVDHIKKQTDAVLDPQLRGRLRKGGRVEFGPLGIEKRALIWKQRSIPWENIRGIRVKKGALMVQMEKPRWFERASLTVPVRGVPNIDILVRLIAEEIEP